MSLYSQGFEQAYVVAMEHEGWGVLTDIVDDPGKMTYSGISRVHHPLWPGWPLIDAGAHMTESGRARLDGLQKEFFNQNFWAEINGDRLFSLNRQLAVKVFDTAVHRSPRTSSLYLQRTLNILNYNQRLYPDLRLDGAIGDRTISALVISLKSHDLQTVLNWFRSIYGADMVGFVETNPKREKFTGLSNRALY